MVISTSRFLTILLFIFLKTRQFVQNNLMVISTSQFLSILLLIFKKTRQFVQNNFNGNLHISISVYSLVDF